MSQATINVVANVLGQSTPVQVSRSRDGAGQWTPSVPAGNAGSLTTRTDNDTGIITLSAGHGLQNGDKVDVFWSGGRRYNMTAGVNVNAVTVDLGSGDNLPAQNAAVVVCRHQVVNAVFDPDDVAVLLVTASRRSSIVFVDSGNQTLLALDLDAGECCLWWINSGITRPMAGNPVAAIWVANGDPAAASDVTVAVVYDATP
jgi:hypothetical protein